MLFVAISCAQQEDPHLDFLGLSVNFLLTFEDTDQGGSFQVIHGPGSQFLCSFLKLA